MRRCEICGTLLYRAADVEEHIRKTRHKSYTAMSEGSTDYLPEGY